MHRYFFYVRSRTAEPDYEGTPLPDQQAAALAAARFAGELLADTPQQLLEEREVRVEVTDGERPLFAVRLIAESVPAALPANEI